MRRSSMKIQWLVESFQKSKGTLNIPYWPSCLLTKSGWGFFCFQILDFKGLLISNYNFSSVCELHMYRMAELTRYDIDFVQSS